MNVLIVDKDKNFGHAMSKLLKKDQTVTDVSYCCDVSKTYEKLKDPTEYYSLGIIDLDTINNTDFFYDDKTKYIVYSSDAKIIKKHINNPLIQRVFQKPINISIFSKYLNNYCGILKDNKDNETIVEKLIRFGFSRSWIGTSYLSEAIELAISGFSKSPKEIYEKLAEIHNTTSNKIFWAINNSINNMVKTDFKENYLDYFEIYDGRKPTPKFIIEYFIAKHKK